MSASNGKLPRATLRIQLHAGYTFDNARADLPYFARLGVTHLYLSPVTQARRSSIHGYDVVDHGKVDEERGGEEALRKLSKEARDAGLGLLLDIVPNHMATDPANGWWWDVLAHGRDSSKATWFDIDWNSPDRPGKVLAPFLGRPYEDALRAGDMVLQHNEQLGLHVGVQGQPYPLSPESLAGLGLAKSGSSAAAEPTKLQACIAAHNPSNAQGRQRLHNLLSKQHYQLAWWRDAAHAINWRRFFEVSELIGVRVEEDAVFNAVHELVLRLYAEGVVDGLRIDHVDGLAYPLSYCRKLRKAMEAVQAQRPPALRESPPWVLVEKILAPGETLDERWAVSGTTGYDFAAQVGALLHAESGAIPLRLAWAEISDDGRSPEAWLHQARQEMLDRHFMAERRNLLRALSTSEYPDHAVETALDALLRHYPTYRSYVEDQPRGGQDQYWFQQAMEGAVADLTGVEGNSQAIAALSWLDERMGGKAPESDHDKLVLQRFQQLTPPLAAKSLEDTVFYRYGSLLSRNEVGSDPAVFALSVEEFHGANRNRAERMSDSLLATATHDHKRGEGSRSRLAVLSEIPELWLQHCRGWMSRAQDTVPPGDQARAFHYMLLQTLVASWPTELSADDAAGVREFSQRVGDWAVKALREGKQLSSWFEPQTEHEEQWLGYLRELQPGGSQHTVLQEIELFVRSVEPAAILNGLVQTALRLTCPGIPDLYQGTEWRDFSLVDPDNRRPVDFEARARSLNSFFTKQGADSALPVLLSPGHWQAQAWADGCVKQALIATLLALRKACPAAFVGDYQPLAVDGAGAQHVVAFSRNNEIVVVAAVKCVSNASLDADGMPVLPANFWDAVSLQLPEGATAWHDVLRAKPLIVEGGQVPVNEVLSGLPLAVLRRDQG